MREVAAGVWQLRGLPPNAINVYLAGDVLVDAGTRRARRRILRQLRGRTVTAHALTHAHPDHQGASAAVCEALGVPLWVGAGDVAAMETPGGVTGAMPRTLVTRIEERFWVGPPRAVDRPLREGDEVAGFTVLDVPGHSAGHVAYWRESDRTLIAGDVLTTMSVRTGLPGLHEPLPMFTPDPARNRESLRRLAALRPEVTLVGHGPPLRGASRLAAFVEHLS
jgi:glyoxylase-like metal-dependent hydrolase (beta-lactamase superfamily II)